jgi:hypothetical protein
MPDRSITARVRRLSVAAAALAAAAVVVPAAASAATSTGPTPSVAPLTVLSGGAARGGDIFLTPTANTPAAQALYANGAEILSPAGRPLWFHQAAPGTVDADLRPQRLDGRRVLTFWEGTNFGGLSDGTDYVYDDRGRQIAAVRAGPGLTTDGHEFLLTPRGTALVVSYDTSTADLTSIGGPADQTVIDGIVQEIDVRTGRVLWSWNASDHVPYSASEQPLPTSATTPWDWFHVNAVHFDTDGNLLIDARDTWAAYKVSPRTGSVIWTLGGKDSSFAPRAAPGQSLDDAGAIFAWQHDPEAIGHDEYTFFDNESAGAAHTGAAATDEFGHSRIVTVKVDPRQGTATLIASDDQPEGQLASSQGNGQRLPDGGEFVGWGILNSVSQFDGAGRLVFNAAFPAGVNTYRAYLDPWEAPGHGHGHGRDHGDGRGPHHR